MGVFGPQKDNRGDEKRGGLGRRAMKEARSTKNWKKSVEGMFKPAL